MYWGLVGSRASGELELIHRGPAEAKRAGWERADRERILKCGRYRGLRMVETES